MAVTAAALFAVFGYTTSLLQCSRLRLLLPVDSLYLSNYLLLLIYRSSLNMDANDDKAFLRWLLLLAMMLPIDYSLFQHPPPPSPLSPQQAIPVIFKPRAVPNMLLPQLPIFDQSRAGPYVDGLGFFWFCFLLACRLTWYLLSWRCAVVVVKCLSPSFLNFWCSPGLILFDLFSCHRGFW